MTQAEPAKRIVQIVIMITGLALIVAGVVWSMNSGEFSVVAVALIAAGFIDLIISWFIFRRS